MYLCIIVRSGISVSASLHNALDEAIVEAQTCGANEFRPDYDDIAVFELSLKGVCEDRIYTYEPPFEENQP